MSAPAAPTLAPYRAATPKAVAAFMASLYELAGEMNGAHAHFGQLVAMVGAARQPGQEPTR